MLFILSGNRLPAVCCTVFVLDKTRLYSAERRAPSRRLQARLPGKWINDPMIRVMRFVYTVSPPSFSHKKAACWVWVCVSQCKGDHWGTFRQVVAKASMKICDMLCVLITPLIATPSKVTRYCASSLNTDWTRTGLLLEENSSSTAACC